VVLAITVWDISPPLPGYDVLLGKASGGAAAAAAAATAAAAVAGTGARSAAARVLGGTAIPLFNRHDVLKTGERKLLLTPGREGDGAPYTRTSTPYKRGPARGLDRLHSMLHRYDNRDLPSVRWLDNLTLRRVERLEQRSASGQDDGGTTGVFDFPPPPSQTSTSGTGVAAASSALAASAASGGEADGGAPAMHLAVELPRFPFAVVHRSKAYFRRAPETLPPRDDPQRVIEVIDPDPPENQNPVAEWLSKLRRTANPEMARQLKPSPAERKKLHDIIHSPARQLDSDQRELLWTYRYSILSDRLALTKFLRATDWENQNEMREALSLVPQWAKVDAADALELLGEEFRARPEVRRYAVEQLDRASDDELESYLLQLVQALRFEESLPSPLSEFLQRRATGRFSLCNLFYWYVSVEMEEPRFAQVRSEFMRALAASPRTAPWVDELELQVWLINELLKLSEMSKSGGRSKAQEQTERMRVLLRDGEMRHLVEFKRPVRIMCRPDIQVVGIVPEQSKMLKSKLAPMMLTFRVLDRPTDRYRVLFKSGDDLRQDQLIVQMIDLMDRLLKKVNLDLKLSPYPVLATGRTQGFIEFVPDSENVSVILAQYQKDITSFLTEHNKRSGMQTALDNFVRSTAGYCVITYLLGIGDRHLDNVLLTKSGQLFHIDFSFIFGRDPKPFPPPMKLSKEMVEVMGGAQAPHYAAFRAHCCSAFSILRKHARLILNLLALMGNAQIPDLMGDLEGKLMATEAKFRLDLSDEDAERALLQLLDDSVNALFPVIMEQIHKWALYWK
jgi:phosphatidylinositol 3-kinase